MLSEFLVYGEILNIGVGIVLVWNSRIILNEFLVRGEILNIRSLHNIRVGIVLVWCIHVQLSEFLVHVLIEQMI